MTGTRKSTALPAVTTLADTDSLMVISAEGNAKRITSANFKTTSKRASVPNAEWVRILAVPGVGSVGIFTVVNPWYNSVPQPVMFAYVVPHSNWDKAGSSLLEKIIGNTGIVTHVRFVYPVNASGGKDVYIEIKPNGPDRTFVIDSILGAGAKALCEAGDIPEGYTAKVFDLNNAGGG